MTMLPEDIQRILSPLTHIGAQPEDDPELRTRKAVMVGLCLAGLCLFLSCGSAYGWFGERLAGAILLAHASIMVVSLLLFHHHRLSYNTFRVSQRLLILLTPLLVTLSLGGLLPSSAIMVWGLLAPLGTALFAEPRVVAWRWSLTYLALLALAGAFPNQWRAETTLPTGLVTLFLVVNLGGISIMVLAATHHFVRQRNLALSLLKTEQAKSEGLLLNILPQEIAAILKNENRVIAEHFNQASILFADVVGFTPLSANLQPDQLVELLNDVFSHFDALAEQHRLEKIKTIGDCYMAASGVPRPRPDHAQALVRMALDMQAYAASRAFAGHRLAFRIGINSGPVVAGVIGRKKFIYDLWGDAVNTASRMESHGAGGLIQITRATYDLIKDDFACEPHGTVNVKGKGEMEVWHVFDAQEGNG